MALDTPNRRWWILGGIRSGDPLPNGRYHYIAKDAKSTLCGIALPDVYGRFVTVSDTPRKELQKHCYDCKVALKGISP
jgi:hypothetical protein